MWKKIFKVGENKTSQSTRISSAYKSTDTEIPSLTLLLKDHKAIRPDGSFPARPLCLASKSPNGILSDTLSEFCDYIADSYGMDTECDSSEDLMAKIKIVNKNLSKDDKYDIIIGSH